MTYIPRPVRLAGAIALFSMSLAAAPAFADVDCSKLPNNPNCKPVESDPPPLAATPELDSLLLFGGGLLGAGGYAMTRFRARRRPDQQIEIGSDVPVGG